MSLSTSKKLKKGYKLKRISPLENLKIEIQLNTRARHNGSLFNIGFV